MTQTFSEECPQFSKSSVAFFAIGAAFFFLSLVLNALCWWPRKRIKKDRGQDEETTGLLASREIPKPLPRDPSTMAALVASGEYLDLDETLTRSMSNSGSFYESIPGGYYPVPMVAGKPELPPPRVPKRNQVAVNRNKIETRDGYATMDYHKVPETTKHTKSGATLLHGTSPHYPNRQRAYKVHRSSEAGNVYITADPDYEIPVTANGITGTTSAETLKPNGTERTTFELSYEVPNASSMVNAGTARSAELPHRVLDNFAEGTCATITDETILPEKLQFMPVTVSNVDTSNITQEPAAATKHDDSVESEFKQQEVTYAPQSKIYATAQINTDKPPKLPPRIHQPRTTDNEPDINMTDGKNKKQTNMINVTDRSTMECNGTEQSAAALREMEESLGPPDAPAPPIPCVPRVPERRPIKK